MILLSPSPSVLFCDFWIFEFVSDYISPSATASARHGADSCKFFVSGIVGDTDTGRWRAVWAAEDVQR
jgi:hypothetical protein